ncbi:YdcF family protein [Flavihumibacter fluvii]|uniref:YdcF family protein n=1 Tax=Flavihumibacter fluvii TaxID=2838157 RepID=UPI001BDE4C0B|nr:YdcF family protein [Flavihumibacter fluvii]ULQ53444.1 YdcF family protein [Flavihumibacter fluvii]
MMYTCVIRSLLFVLFIMIIAVNLSCSYSSKATKKLLSEAENAAPYDLVIIPGVPLENGSWSTTMKARITWSLYLFKRGITRNVMYSGAAVSTPFKEGDVMGMYARALGIPAEHVFTETLAEHSTENIYYSYKKAGKLGFSRIALASDPFQTKMLRRFTRKKLSPDIGMLPIVLDTLKKLQPTITDPVLSFDTIRIDPFQPLSKRQGFLDRLRGTRGKHINQNAYE